MRSTSDFNFSWSKLKGVMRGPDLLRDKFLVQIFELLQAVFVFKQLLYRAILF